MDKDSGNIRIVRCPHCKTVLRIKKVAGVTSGKCGACGKGFNYTDSLITEVPAQDKAAKDGGDHTDIFSANGEKSDDKTVPVPDEDEDDPLIGAQFRNFKIIRKIGSGGMADLYLGYQESLERHVAVKILPLHFARQKDFIRRFQREARSAAKLNQRNIITIFDVGCENKYHYILMEYIDGLNIAQYLDVNKTFSINEGLRIIRDVAKALEFAHSYGIIHRDIKPDNILLDKNNRTIVTDFGIAKAKTDTRITATSMNVGTPRYMSPEQAQGQSLDFRSDIYSLGVMAYEMLSGSLPFQATDPISLAMKHVIEDPPPITQINPNIPLPVEKFIHKMLRKNPDDRYQSAGEIVDELDSILGITKHRTPTARKKTQQRQKPEKLVPAKPGREIKSPLVGDGIPPKGSFGKWIVILFFVLGTAVFGMMYGKQSYKYLKQRVTKLASNIAPGIKKDRSRFKETPTPKPKKTRTTQNVIIPVITKTPTPTKTPTKRRRKKPKPTFTPKPKRKKRTPTPRPTKTPVPTPTPLPTTTPVPTFTLVPTIPSPTVEPTKPLVIPSPLSRVQMETYMKYVKDMVGDDWNCYGFLKMFDQEFIYQLKRLYLYLEDEKNIPINDLEKIVTGLIQFYLHKDFQYKIAIDGTWNTKTHKTLEKFYKTHFQDKDYTVPSSPTLIDLENILKRVVDVKKQVETSLTQSSKKEKTKLPNRPRKGKTYIERTNGLNLKMIWIKSGECWIGSSKTGKYSKESEFPRVKIKITGFWISETEITNEQYEKSFNRKDLRKKHLKDRLNKGYAADEPVVWITWYAAQKFCDRLFKMTGTDYRLPTEAQWEYAVRAGTSTMYFFGNSKTNLPNYVWYRNNSRRKLHPVKQLKPNQWGVYDILGNVREWCFDLYDSNYYGRLSDGEVNPVSIYGSGHVVRGGDYTSRHYDVRCAARFSLQAQEKGNNVGFRVIIKP